MPVNPALEEWVYVNKSPALTLTLTVTPTLTPTLILTLTLTLP